MAINTGKGPKEAIEERVKEVTFQEADIYKYLEMVVNIWGNLENHKLEINRKYELINWQISEIGTKHSVGKEEIKVKLKLYETYITPALLNGLETWGEMDRA